MSDIKNKIEAAVKNTVGYAESENKESFMTGANVALSKAEELYGEEIKQLKLLLELYKAMSVEATEDMKTLASIINKYSNAD